MQEDASKLSKRAKRRAEGEGSAASGAVTDPEAAAADQGDEDEVDPEEGEVEPAAAGAAPAPNRQARRTAAAKARAQRKQARAEATAIGLDAGEMVDDALVRFTDKVSRLFRRHWNTLQWIIGLGIIGWFGYQIFAWRRNVTNAAASDALHDALMTEQGTIGNPEDQGKPNENGIIVPTPIFETPADRLTAALAAYDKAATEYSGKVTALFARLGRAGLWFETGKWDEALAEYEAVIAESAAPERSELRGNALEGKGLTLEAKGDLKGALAAFEQLEPVEGFANRGVYQQARMKHLLGDDAAAKALLNKLFKALGPPPAANLGGLPNRPDFMRERAVQLAALIDPLEKDVQIPKPPTGQAAVQQMLDQLKESGALSEPTAPNP